MAIKRTQVKTILLFGEGKAEVELFSLLKLRYVPRNCGVSATIDYAGGKGPAHIIDSAIRYAAQAAYDVKIILLDDDLTCPAKEKKTATECGFILIKSSPCLEAELLKTRSIDTSVLNSQDCKARFEREFGGEAHKGAINTQNFPDACHNKSIVIASIIKHIESLKPR